LLADGVIGAKTYEALRTPLEQRVQQIESSMQRLRALSAETLSVDTQQRFILINIPQFTLWAYAPGIAPLKMAVVIGNAAKSQTPIFSAEMSHVIFNPYWNVPRSIAVKELLPKIDKNPGYLLGEDMELVAKDGSVYSGAVTREQRNGIVLGDYRIRQRPGEKNALGNVKFMFPNDDSIYMHDTPSKNLFARERRDFSHGCIRLGNPLGMASYTLAASGVWDEASIDAQIATGREKHLRLQQNIPVLITYFTANVDEQGRAVFVPDIYGLDAT
jgi:murein L,D-transpeptidase YcbB/YkuD